MKINQLHDWHVSIEQAKQIQKNLSGQISQRNEIHNNHFIAGADISAPDSRGIARAAVVVLAYPTLEVAEIKTTDGELFFPYIPGLLSFREAPLLAATFEKISASPGVLFVDGQGIAHPRRLGIASHLGLILGIPTIGCAKSRLCGQHKPLITPKVGSYTELLDKGEVIGVVMVTKANTTPIYVSIGHKIDLTAAKYWVLECCAGYRLPEPCRLAHIVAGGKQITLNNQSK